MFGKYSPSMVKECSIKKIFFFFVDFFFLSMCITVHMYLLIRCGSSAPKQEKCDFEKIIKR